MRRERSNEPSTFYKGRGGNLGKQGRNPEDSKVALEERKRNRGTASTEDRKYDVKLSPWAW